VKKFEVLYFKKEVNMSIWVGVKSGLVGDIRHPHVDPQLDWSFPELCARP
jgi:hypothetical protein